MRFSTEELISIESWYGCLEESDNSCLDQYDERLVKKIRRLISKETSQQPVKAKCGCKHEDRFDCEYMDENKNCAINKKG